MGDSALVSITALFFPSPPPLPPPLSEFGAPPPSTQCKLKLYKFSLSQSNPWKEGEGERQRERKGGSLEQRGGRHPTQGNWRLCLTYNTVIPLLFILSFHPLSPLPYPKMSTALVSPTIFELSEVLCKGNKMLNYSPSSVGGCLLDRKAVGTPAGGGFSRRHSVTLPNSKFHQNQLLSSLKGEPAPVLGPRESRFRDRSFSEGGERLLPQKQPGGQVNSSRYKTELCRPFEENGACKYGDKCQFAHGIHELRSLTRHPKYKTELCRTFHTIGFCPYGPRCHFIHNAEERRAVAGARDPAVADRPRLQHSFSFAGFPSSAANGLLDSPTSITPPPILSADDLLGSPTLPDCASNPFTFSSQELASLFAPSMGVQVPSGGSPTAFLFRPMSESPNMFDSPPSPQDSLSDQEGYLSSSSSSHSGSDSPILDTSRRLPIFSRLSISDD